MKEKDKKSRMLTWVLLFLGSFSLGGVSRRVYRLGQFLSNVTISEESVIYVLSAILLGLYLATYYFNHESRKGYKQLQEVEDDNESDSLYRKTYRYMEYGILLHNIFVVILILIVFFFWSPEMGVFPNLTLIILVCLDCLMAILSKLDMYRTIKLIRGYNHPMMSLPRDALALVNSFDEGERQANLEQSFLILFQLDNIVLPILYCVLFLISLVMQSQQIVAYVTVAFIHFYINVMQYKMIKQYFK